MANFECPLCHSATEPAGKQRYCPRCGWNKKRAAEQLRFSQRMFPVAIVLVAALTIVFMRGAAKQKDSAYWVIVVVPGVIYALAYVSVKRSLRKLEAVPDPPGAAVDEKGEAALEKGGAVEPSEADLALLRTTPPRKTRMGSRGKKSLSFIAAVVCLFEGILIWQLHRMWELTRSFEGYQRKDWALLGLVVVLAVLPLSAWRSMARERELLENGELTLGRVTKRWDTRDGATIYYEFQDASGQTHKHSGMDYSRRIEIGMGVPVFYDRDNPKRQIAACAALHEVVIG